MKSINKQAPVQCSKTMVIDAKPEKVWAILTDINQWPQWQEEVSQAKLNGPLQPNTTFDWKNGSTKIHSILHTIEPNHQIGWTGKVFGIHAIHNFMFEPVNGGTQVTVGESMEGLLAKLFKGSFNKMLEKNMMKSLEELKVACEK